jgi:hypothetical protein
MTLKLLLNNKEIVNFLNSKLEITQHLLKFEMSMPVTADTIVWMKKIIFKRGKPNLDDADKKRFKDKLLKAVRKDISAWFDLMKLNVSYYKENNWNTLHKKIDYVLEKLGEDFVIEEYKKSSVVGFVKGTGLKIDPTGKLLRRHHYKNYDEDCLIRNTVGNEELLVTKIDRSFPFWFIDSGYTNFLESNKKWHRLVRNHLHIGNYFNAPVDRLNNFKTFPKPWRTDGHVIYVLEPGPFAANIFHVDLKTWKYEIEKELRKHTDKKIKFREKAPKKQRISLYKELEDDDFYCLISINSNGATEAVWQGVPIITLDKHITNPVARNKIQDINNLYRDRIADWLCMLSYSQFTFDELINGTAYKLVKQYNG